MEWMSYHMGRFVDTWDNRVASDVRRAVRLDTKFLQVAYVKFKYA
jgi:hypothetical protein